MLSINTNITSMLAMNALNKNTGVMNTALNRLSTGFRINSSKDDAAGSAISASLSKEISSFDVAQDNAQMGQSMIDTASSTISNIQNMVQRIRDLAVESANGTYGDAERKAMQNEVSSLVDEIYRIKETTEFNGKKLFGTESVEHINEAKAEAMGYTVVKTAEELKNALENLDAKVMLFADIDLDDLGVDETGSNWTAVGTSSAKFKGTLDGNGFTISNLKINQPTKNYQGLFSYTDGATISNVNLENVNITTNNYAGGIAGDISNNSLIENCNVSGTVNCTGNWIGGIAGQNTESTIDNCSSSATVVGKARTGGIVGVSFNTTTITNCTFSGNVDGKGTSTGGIAGLLENSTLENCYSSGSVKGFINTGGIVGESKNNNSITNCKSSGDVSGSSVTGGISGYTNTSSITNCKSSANVSGSSNVGAVIGRIVESGTIENSEYNSTINEGLPAVGKGLPDPDDTQIRDNQELVIDTNIPKAKSMNPVKLQVGINSDNESNISVDTGFEMGLFAINIETENGATKAIDRIDKMMSKLTTKQTELASASNRLQSAMEFQQVQKDTKMAVLSVIKDADIAKESSDYIKAQILQQTTASLLAQANQTPSIALRLLAI